MLLNLHDDPDTEADFRLAILEDHIREICALGPEALSHYRDRAADLADQQTINAPRRPL